MKIHRFLIFVQNTLLNKPDISISTIKQLINKFESCLSITESRNETTFLLLRVIKEIGIKQISLKEMNDRIIFDKLENELNGLKNEKN